MAKVAQSVPFKLSCAYELEKRKTQDGVALEFYKLPSVLQHERRIVSFPASQCPAEREKANSTFFSAVKRQLLLHARYCRQNDVLGRVRTQCIRNRVDLHIAQDDKDPHPIARFEFSSVTTEIRVTGVRGENLSLMRRPFF